MFDPVSMIWYKQAASGPTPSSRLWFCASGVGDSRPVKGGSSTGTYEMYVFSNNAIPTPLTQWRGSPEEARASYSSLAASRSASRVENNSSLLVNHEFGDCYKM